jgi:hypothetical protein
MIKKMEEAEEKHALTKQLSDLLHNPPLLCAISKLSEHKNAQKIVF